MGSIRPGYMQQGGSRGRDEPGLVHMSPKCNMLVSEQVQYILRMP